jgi:hypothetical protein
VDESGWTKEVAGRKKWLDERSGTRVSSNHDAGYTYLEGGNVAFRRNDQTMMTNVNSTPDLVAYTRHVSAIHI